jgi:hypothetical protein
MKLATQYLLVFMLLTAQLYAAEVYSPDSGDKQLNEILEKINQNINRKHKIRLAKFVDKVADDFQIPPMKVEELFNHYEFNAADVLMSVAIADVSGEPLKNIAGLYYKHKDKGWKYTLNHLNIKKDSKVFEQIKKDLNTEY